MLGGRVHTPSLCCAMSVAARSVDGPQWRAVYTGVTVPAGRRTSSRYVNLETHDSPVFSHCDLERVPVVPGSAADRKNNPALVRWRLLGLERGAGIFSGVRVGRLQLRPLADESCQASHAAAHSRWPADRELCAD